MRKIYFIETLLLSVLFSMFIQQEAIAVVADSIEYLQPDGTVVTILLKGNENLSWAETLNGYTIA